MLQKGYLLLDGATGTNLMAAGMPGGVCVEEWILAHPQVFIDLQLQFLQAGSRLLLTPTFGANAGRLKQHGLAEHVVSLNRQLAKLTLQAVDQFTGGGRIAPDGSRILIAGDVSPSGLFCEPMGNTPFCEIIDLYAHQIEGLRAAGVDLIVAETMMNLGDVRAAVIAAREAGLPAVASITVDENGRTLSGLNCETGVLSLQSAGAAAVGMNCSYGPEKMLPLLARMKKLAAIPLLSKPNAGTPEAPLSPEPFARAAALLAEDGAALLGGCCQTTPAHIAALSARLQSENFAPCSDGIWQQLQRICTPALPEGLPLCLENRIWPLEDLDIHALSAPLPCDDTLEELLPDADDGEATGILIDLHAQDDPRALVRAAVWASLPLVLQADTADTLDQALRLICGRVAVLCTGDSQIRVAQKWGAAVFRK